MKENRLRLLVWLLLGPVLGPVHGQTPLLPPTEVAALRYTNEFFPGTAYRAGMPTQQGLLGFAAGQKAASGTEIERCLEAWTAVAPDRSRLVEYARSYEGRPLYLVVVTAPKNLARLEEIQTGVARLGDPRRLSDGQADELIASLPAVAWLGYTNHGDETEGSDAALAVLYHLIAASDAQVEKLLEDVVVIIDPEGRSASLSSNQLVGLKEWVKAGGTLIAVGSSANAFAAERADFSKVRPLPEVLGRLAEYELAILREWLGRSGPIPAAEAVWAHQATPGLPYPWPAAEGAQPEEKELKKRDAWQSLFMPQGAMLASRVDTNHWLTFGCGDLLPVLVGRQPVLMAAEGVEAPVRYGYLCPATKPTNAVETADPRGKPASGAEKKEPENKDKKETPRVGWCALPDGTEMYLRMSGLYWPEASHRLANAAWVTREHYGRGQVILFATPPTFRVALRGPTRVMLNAMVYGPGFGAEQPVRP